MVKTLRKGKSFFSMDMLMYLRKKFPKLKGKVKLKEHKRHDEQEGSSMEKNNEVIKKIRNDESIYVIEGGKNLSINNSRLSSSGNTTKEEDSSSYGLNAAILAKEGSKVEIKNSTITTTGKGANAVFSLGENSVIDIDNVVIKTKGHSANGLSAASRGTVQAHDIAINTEGNNSSAIAVCKEKGIIEVSNSSGICEGENSPCIYSKGNIVVNDSNFKAEKSEAAVVDGKSIVLNNTSLSAKEKNGVMIFQKGDKSKETGKCVFTSNLGSITAGKGSMFYITNAEAIISLFNTKLILSMDNILINACKSEWGLEGNNGGSLTLIGNHQTLNGDILCDELSTVELNLKDYTYYTGIIDADKKGAVSIDLDSTSVWTLTGTSYIDYIIDENKDFDNIVDNGHNVFYNAENEKNKWLEGREFNLTGGGKLMPA